MPEQEYLVALDYVIPLIRRQQADLYVFPHEPHIKFQPRHKLAVYQRNLDWFRFWLQDYEDPDPARSEEHTSELQSLMRISYAVFCLKTKMNTHKTNTAPHSTHTNTNLL